MFFFISEALSTVPSATNEQIQKRMSRYLKDATSRLKRKISRNSPEPVQHDIEDVIPIRNSDKRSKKLRRAIVVSDSDDDTA